MSAPTPAGDGATDLSRRYDTPLGLAHTTVQALKDRIKLHYDLASEYYLSLWGEHIHHGYWPTDASKASDSKETAQLHLIRLLLDVGGLLSEEEQSGSNSDGSGRDVHRPLRILDVGCGIGGTARYLAGALGAAVTGLTISGKQVQMATRLSREAAAAAAAAADAAADAAAASTSTDTGSTADADPDGYRDGGFIRVCPRGGGKVRFVELDADRMGEYFFASPAAALSPDHDDDDDDDDDDDGKDNKNEDKDRDGDGQSGPEGQEQFDVVWISEALSHLADKALFFRNAQRLLRRRGGRLVVADWFRAEGLGEGEVAADIKPIEDGMLLPPLCTQAEYVRLAAEAGLRVLRGPIDISRDVSKTWDISWSLVQNPSLWAFAFSQGRDGIAFLQAFRAMRRGYANGSFRYAVMSFVKP